MALLQHVTYRMDLWVESVPGIANILQTNMHLGSAQCQLLARHHILVIYTLLLQQTIA